MANTSSSLSFLLDEIVSALAYESFYGMPFAMPMLFSVRGSSRRRERTASIGGLTTWDAKTVSSEPSEDSLIQQFEKDFVHTAYGIQVPVERELIDDQEYGLLQEIGNEIGSTAGQTMETHAAEVWDDFVGGSTHLAEDSLTVCNNAHVNVDGGNSQDNLGTDSLDEDGLNNARVAMRGFTNYRGDKAPSIPRLLVVPPALERTGWELVKSEKRPNDANNALNMFQGLEMLTWDFLSSSTKWYMCDTVKMAQNLLWFQRIGMEIFGDGNLFTGTRRLGGYMRYSRGVKDWRWIYGQNPS